MLRDLTVVFCVTGFTLSLAWVVRATQVCIKLKARADSAEARVAALQMAVLEARHVFAAYDSMHAAKGTIEGDAKAAANRELAQAMDRALKESHYRELSGLQTNFIIAVRRAERQARKAMAPFGRNHADELQLRRPL